MATVCLAAPAGRSLLFVDTSGALRVANVSERETRIPRDPIAPSRGFRRLHASPDGLRLLLESARPDGLATVWLVDLSDQRLTSLGAGLQLPSSPASPFSPEGRRIALRRQNRDEIAIFSATTRGLLRTVAVPGICDAPAWFGDGWHLAVAGRPAAGGSAVHLVDGHAGRLLATLLSEEGQTHHRFEYALPGMLVYRETWEGVDHFVGLSADGAVSDVDPPQEEAPLPDLPEGVRASISPEGLWAAYIQGDALYLRWNKEGSEAVRLAPAVAFLWKPGPPLPERFAPVPPPAIVPTVEPPAPAILPGLLALRVQSGEAVEGQPLEVTWEASARVSQLRLSAMVVRAPRGGAQRGSYVIPIAGVAGPLKRYVWRPPWLDNIRFTLRAEALDASGRRLGRCERVLDFRPRELADRREDGIYVHLSNRQRQRLYVQEGGRLTFVALCSGASTHRILPPGQHPDDPHDHYGTFRISGKDPDHVSNLNEEWRMPYAMRYLMGHYIHVTSRNQYHRLGRPASHGCVRLHRVDGVRLYERTRVGESVTIF